jgi:Rab-GTPase-TBC domain
LIHIKSEDLSLGAAFSPVFITLFVYQVPLEIATRIFECFILDGEIAIVKILLRMLYHKRDTILSLHECELLNYLRTGMVVECVQEVEIEDLISH